MWKVKDFVKYLLGFSAQLGSERHRSSAKRHVGAADLMSSQVGRLDALSLPMALILRFTVCVL